MHPLPLMRRPRSWHSHRSSWPIFWLVPLEPGLSPGPCLPACRAVGPIHADALPHTVYYRECWHGTACSYKPDVGANPSRARLTYLLEEADGNGYGAIAGRGGPSRPPPRASVT